MVIANGQPSTDTYNTYKAGIESFLDWCLKYARVNPFILKEKHLELYRDWLYKSKTVNGTDYSKSTVYNRLVAIRAFYHAAVKQKIITENPCLDVKSPSVAINDLPFSYFKMDQIGKITRYVRKNFDEFECYRNLACIYLMAVGGLRCVEVHRANQEDINWNDFTMLVHGKGHNGIIYLDEYTGKILKEYIDCVIRQPFAVKKEGENTPLIISNATNNSGKRLARNSIRWNMNRVLEGAGFKQKGAACHIFRHSCATALYKTTHDLRVVQDVLRHRNPNVTARYAHVVEQLQNRPTNALGKMID